MARVTRAPSVGSTSPQRLGIMAGLETAPPVLAPRGRGPGTPLLVACESIALLGTDTANTQFPLFELPSSATVYTMNAHWGGTGSGDSFDVGIYVAGSSTAVDADLFTVSSIISNADVTGADPVGADFGNYAVPFDPSMRLWESLDLAKDPQIVYDVSVTLNSVLTNDVNLTITMFYST